MSNNNELLKPVVMKALEDSKFAEELKNNPRAALAKHGFELPEAEMQKIEQAESLEALAAPADVIGGVLF
jgi:hypothetical protein